MITQNLSPLDLYALSRAFVGLPTGELSVTNPVVMGLLSNIDWSNPQQLGVARNILRDSLPAILAVDPNGPPPAPTSLKADHAVVPDLPRMAKLPDKAVKQGERVGQWVTDGMEWLTNRSPMTPPSFLRAGLLWAIGLVTARRVVLRLPHAAIYPHLYALWIAPTSVYRKSTGLAAINDLVSAVVPHLLLPEESSPESLFFMLAGRKAENFDDLPAYEQEIEIKGMRFAGQRGMLIDEASRMFLAKDYMKGISEAYMALYDAPPVLRRYLRSTGKLVVREPALSILGATTPAALARNMTWDMWENGLFARFLLMVPEYQVDFTTGTDEDHLDPPPALTTRLRALNTMLPEPPNMEAIQVSKEPATMAVKHATITTEAYKAFHAYTEGVGFELLKADQMLDERIRGNYSRFPIQALKVAMNLATIDWADGGDASAMITITLAHWAAAQEFAEHCRKSLHDLLVMVNQSLDNKSQNRVVQLLIGYPNGMTAREMSQLSGLPTKHIYAALDILAEAGAIQVMERESKRGPKAKVYQLIEENL